MKKEYKQKNEKKNIEKKKQNIINETKMNKEDIECLAIKEYNNNKGMIRKRDALIFAGVIFFTSGLVLIMLYFFNHKGNNLSIILVGIINIIIAFIILYYALLIVKKKAVKMYCKVCEKLLNKTIKYEFTKKGIEIYPKDNDNYLKMPSKIINWYEFINVEYDDNRIYLKLKNSYLLLKVDGFSENVLVEDYENVFNSHKKKDIKIKYRYYFREIISSFSFTTRTLKLLWLIGYTLYMVIMLMISKNIINKCGMSYYDFERGNLIKLLYVISIFGYFIVSYWIRIFVRYNKNKDNLIIGLNLILGKLYGDRFSPNSKLWGNASQIEREKKSSKVRLNINMFFELAIGIDMILCLLYFKEVNYVYPIFAVALFLIALLIPKIVECMEACREK